MNRVIIALLLVAIPTIATAKAVSRKQITYAVLVPAAGGKCNVQIEDVVLDAQQVRIDLKDIANKKHNLIIYYNIGAPVRCVNVARMMLSGIGFRKVYVEAAPADMKLGWVR